MTDITKYIPTNSKTVEAIYAYHKKRGDSEPSRGYLGASIIGHECERFLWYNFRQACKTSFSGRLYRLFETGDLAEFRFCDELRAIGCEVHEHDGQGGQWEVNALGGHFSGHMDGAVLKVPEAPKTWHVAEFKTHNNKSFVKLKAGGVKKSKPMHYGQVMAYMHLTGMKRALYIAVNKDTEELYSERIKYNKSEAEAYITKAERIITSNSPPERISDREDFWQCGWCDAKEVCWGSKASALPVVSLSCRHCCHATAELDGDSRWSCRHHGFIISESQMNVCCDRHLVLPGLLSFAEPIDYQATSEGEQILFKNKDGSQWIHGSGPKSLDSRSLMAIPPDITANPMILEAADVFDITVTDVQDDIHSRYGPDVASTVWIGKPEEIVEEWQRRYDDDLRTLTPVSRCSNEFYRAVEASGERAAIIITEDTKDWAEIREAIN